MARTRALLVGALIVLTACSAGADPQSSPAAPRTSATEEAPPYRLAAGDALRAVGWTTPGVGLRISDRCDSRRDRSCVTDRWRGTSWLVGWAATGGPLPEGNGLHEYARAVLTRWPTAPVARRALREAWHEVDRFRGDFNVPMKKIGPNRYLPGDRGKGELQRVSLRGWRGVGVRKIFVHYFDTNAASGTVLGGRFVLRRGPYVADVEWVTRTQASDRRLSHLPSRLILGLP